MEKQKPLKIEKTNSGKKTRMYLAILLVGVVLAIGALFRDNLLRTEEVAEDINLEEETNKDEVANYLEGILKRSDDDVRGNLKLVSGASEIYLRTGRDYSALIGAEVIVFIEGTLENFKLLDIQNKIEKDGFIKLQ